MRLSARELSAFIGAVYEAGLDPVGAGWPAVLERLSLTMAGGGPVGLVLEHRRFEYAHAHYAATDPNDVAGYLGHYARIDPVFEPRLPSARPGEVLLSDALVSAEELQRSEFHADWLRPRGLGSGAATVLLRHNSSAAALYAVRPRRGGAFTPEELEALHLLVPHVAAAVRASLQLAALVAARDATANALDRWDQAVLLVDSLAHVRVANRTADALLSCNDGLALEPARGLALGRLRAATPTATAELRSLVATAATIATPTRAGGGDPVVPRRPMAMSLSRPSGRPALAALVTPLSPAVAVGASWMKSLDAGAARATVAVFVSDPAAAGAGAVAQERLREAYRLTPAEAAIAVAVANGDGHAAVALANGVSLATVRTQARQAYRKTGVRGQAALARLVERLAHVR